MRTTTIGLGLAAVLSVLGPARDALAAQEPGAPTTNAEIEDAVVKVYVTASPPDPFTPWQRMGTEPSTGSGVIIPGNRILTNAHVVDDAVSIEVKRAKSSGRHDARIVFVDHQADLALLEADDPSFFAGARPMRLGTTPQMQTGVQAYGFPLGGDSISVTSGIISRVEIGSYAHAMETLLLAQIDAALNPGNSGGPVMAGQSLVGIAVQILDQAENVGYMIPASVIQHFLDDIADGRVDGFPDLGILTQGLESTPLRHALGLKDPQSGALVTWVDHGAPADGVLQLRDVLLEIDGMPIANDQTVDWPGLGRVHFSQACKTLQVGELVRLKLLRRAKVIDSALTLDRHRALVPGRRATEAPQYLVFAGFVFQPLTVNYLLFLEEIPYDLGDYATVRNLVTPERNQVILLQKVLPHAVNRGYQTWQDQVVETVNGAVPRDMAQLASLIDEARGPFLEIVTGDRSLVTVGLAEARTAQGAILESYGVPFDRSPDLRAGTPRPAPLR